MDWLLKIMSGGFVQVGNRSQFIAAAVAIGAVITAVAQYLTGTDMSFMTLVNLIGEKWPVIVGGLYGYTMAAKVEALK